MDWMNFIVDWMNFIKVETGLIVVEGTILLSLLITFVYLRRILARSTAKESPSLDSNRLRDWVRESDAICQDLSKNLDEKRAIVGRLIAQMDEKIQTFQALLKEVDGERGVLARDGKEKDLGDQVSEMTQAGCEVSEVARRLQLSKGEVELILDLKRYRQ